MIVFVCVVEFLRESLSSLSCYTGSVSSEHCWVDWKCRTWKWQTNLQHLKTAIIKMQDMQSVPYKRLYWLSV